LQKIEDITGTHNMKEQLHFVNERLHNDVKSKLSTTTKTISV